MTELFSHQDLPDGMLPKMYELMAAAATVDLHWEVKTRVLDFWEKVIWEQLKHQGVIDGAFPEVTFSKELRKIVTLTHVEIHKRLNKVLLELSGNGCLEVLLSTMQDGCDAEVVKRAVDVTKKFVAFLKKYKVSSCEVENVILKRFLKFLQQDLDKLPLKKSLSGNVETLESILDNILSEQEYEDINRMDCQ